MADIVSVNCNSVLCITDTLVNGEYFLGLPEDEELLEGNKLSPAFEKWIKEVCHVYRF